jgi:UDP-N-acetylglucosamine acyltransferase
LDTIHPNAVIEKDVIVAPNCVIEEKVKIGSGTSIGEGAIIKNGTEIGKDNEIHPYTIIGNTPQDKSYKGEGGKVVIGNNNIIREFTTIHLSVGKDTKTLIGDNNYIMAYAHIAHNCIVGNNVLLVNGATLGGHVEVEDYAYISAFVPVHQWIRIGAYSLIGGGFRITKDLIPYALAADSPIRVVSPNFVGLRRNGFSNEQIENIKNAYRILFRSNLNTRQAIEKLIEEFDGNKDIERIINFINKSKRGIVKG